MNTIIFILSILSAIVTGGIKFVQNLKQSENYLENGVIPQQEIVENDSNKQG